MMVDTHAHMLTKYYDDLDETLAIIRDLAIINCGTDQEDNKEVLTLCKKQAFLWGSLGIHPHAAEEWNENIARFIYENSKNEHIVAVGEIGLDYYYGENCELQKKVFRDQMELAVKLNKPVIIHSRNALADTLEILKDYPKIPKVIHSFDYDWLAAQQFIALNCFIGINGIITFEKDGRLAEIVQKIDLDQLLVETDSPYLTPVPHRGKRNDSRNLKYIIEKIAELRAQRFVEIKEQTAQNAIELFDLKLEKW